MIGISSNLPECVGPALHILGIRIETVNVHVKLIKQASAGLVTAMSTVFKAVCLGLRVALLNHHFGLCGTSAKDRCDKQ